jgi:hypothetical protein
MAPPFNQLHTSVNTLSTIRRNGISEIPIDHKEHEGHKDFDIIVQLSFVNFVVKTSHYDST